MNYRVLCVTDRSDLPETELFIGLKNSGVDIDVFCNPSGRYHERLLNSAVKSMPLILKSRFDLPGIRIIRRQLKRKKYDLIYCFNNPAVSNALLAAVNIPGKFITYRGTIGNIHFLSPASWTTHLNPRVARIVCVSNAVRDHLLNMKFLSFTINPERVITIYKGHDVRWYQNPPADLSEFNTPHGAFIVGFAGRDRPHKGINVLIDSLRWLPERMPVHLFLMGKLEANKRVNKLINNSPGKERIHLLKYREDAPAIAAACDAFIMPSTKREGLSRAVIEAMSCGTIPIVTDVGGLPELVINNQSGLVVPPENPEAIARAIMFLYEHPERKVMMGKHARKRIETHFNIEKTIAETKEMFERIVEDS
jgi:glycosyltransferase involved in cell wall biosynthesis